MCHMEQQMQDQIEGGLIEQELIWDDILFQVACLSANVGASGCQRNKFESGRGLAFQHKKRAKEIICLINNQNNE